MSRKLVWAFVMGIGALTFATRTARAATPAEGETSSQAEAQSLYRGLEAGGALGTGFGNLYGVGFSGRLGYGFAAGPYVGGAVTQFVGSGSRSASFFGAEGGYKFYPTLRWEIRPYGFLGPAVIDRANGFGPELGMAFQPSVLTAYHSGPWFVLADARLHAVPDPAAFALLLGAGAEL